MKSMITKTEEKKYYKHIYLLLPVYVGLLFSVSIYFLYNLIMVIFYDTGFEFKWLYIFIAFAFGFIEGLSTIYFTLKLNHKKNLFFTNYYKKAKLDIYIPVILKDCVLKNSKGVLLISKDTIEYKVYQMFEKKSLFVIPNNNAKFTIIRQDNQWLKRILTLTKYTNLLKLKIDDKEFEFIVPCLDNIAHRIDTYHL